jgi:thioredoxin reductase (NADPH)
MRAARVGGTRKEVPMPNVIIIGSGPAGVSASLYTARAGLATTVLTMGPGALRRAEHIQNYYGFSEPISGDELERRGIEGARAVGVQFVQAEAVGLTFTDKLTVETLAGEFPADAVILATGASRAAPRIPGLAALEGHGVSYCAVCDAFFYRGKDVAILGSGEYALHEAAALLPLARSVTLLTGGAPLAAQFPPEVAVRTEAVEAILGEDEGRVTGVRLAGGAVLPAAGVFVAQGVAGSTALARKIGAALDDTGTHIAVDAQMQTTVPGLYAVGDCTGGLLQVAKAVYEGALAGSEVAKALRKAQQTKGGATQA